MSDLQTSAKFYSDDVNFKDVNALGEKLQALVQRDIESIADLEA